MGEMASHTLELLKAMRGDIAEIKQDVGVLKEDVGELKYDVGVLKRDMTDVKGQLAAVQSQVSSLASQTASLTGSVLHGFDRLTEAVEAGAELGDLRHEGVDRRMREFEARLARVEARHP